MAVLRRKADADAVPAGGEQTSQAGELRSARVESLRAIAALGVLSGHVYGFANTFALTTFSDRLFLLGGFGVFLFFALSGYLIYWPFARRDFGGGAEIDYRRYGVNRALRILPLYWISVAIVLVWQADGGTGQQWLRFMLLSQNFYSGTIGSVNGVLWSVVVEVHFYLLLPILALGIGRVAKGSRRKGAAAIALCGLASLALWYFQVDRHPANEVWRYSMPTTFYFFTGGMLLAILRTKWLEQRPAWLSSALGRADLWLLASVPLWLVIARDYGIGWTAVLPCTLMVAACVLPLRPGRLVRVLDWRPLAALGVASYSLYVWHVPVLREVTSHSWAPTSTLGLAAVAIPISIAVALLSYRLIETPFLRLRRRWSTASADIEPATRPRSGETTALAGTSS